MDETKNTRTIIYCPNCHHRTYTAIRYGEVNVHCKHCGYDIIVIIPFEEGGEGKKQ